MIVRQSRDDVHYTEEDTTQYPSKEALFNAARQKEVSILFNDIFKVTTPLTATVNVYNNALSVIGTADAIYNSRYCLIYGNVTKAVYVDSPVNVVVDDVSLSFYNLCSTNAGRYAVNYGKLTTGGNNFQMVLKRV
jgi:muramidase (phage lysozyme)